MDSKTSAWNDALMAHIRVSHSGDGVATITLDRPQKKNALSVALREEMLEALETLGADESVSCVVVTGEGDTFSSGFDLSEFSKNDEDFQRRLWDSSDRFHQALLRFPLPLVAAVNGPALAGGFDLAVLCDLRNCLEFGPLRPSGTVLRRRGLSAVTRPRRRSGGSRPVPHGAHG